MLVFGPFDLDVGSYRLRRNGQVVAVEPQVIDVIAYLAMNRERLVPKEELLDNVWGDRFVSESALTSRIKSARQALGDDGRTQSMIRTVHGRGYQFVPLVTDSDALPPAAAAVAVDQHTDEPDRSDDATDRASARRSADAGHWADARRQYAALGVGALDAADLERWGAAAWWTNEIVECISVRQEAYRRYHAEGDNCSAARLAIDLSENYLHRGSSTVALTWLDRARDLLSSSPDCREAGQLLRMQSTYELELHGDPHAALASNARLRELAQSLGDPDLIAQSLQDHGRILLAFGDVDDGMAIIDRAMLVAATTDITPHVRGRLYCNMLSACVGLGHIKRAFDWSDEALTWCATRSDSPFPGLCQVHRAGLRRRTGELGAAFDDLERLAVTSQMSNIAGPALIELGEIHLARDEADAAREAFLRAHALGADTTVGFAHVAIAEGRAAEAVDLLRGALAATPSDVHRRCQLLPHLVDAAAVAGDVEVASSAADELERLSTGSSEVVRACAAHAAGSVALLVGRDSGASEAFRAAAALYRHASLPLDLAATRLGLAVASDRLGALAEARVERDAALATYRQHGAVPHGIARRWLDELDRRS